MIVRAVAMLAVMMLPGISEGGELKFVKKIGVPDSSDWMSFVTFSSDGTRVASDRLELGPKAEVSLTIWSFPEGRLIKTFPVAPQLMSKNLRYYVLNDSVVDFTTDKSVMALPKGASGTFSADGRYFAESYPDDHGSSARTHVVEIPSGKQIGVINGHISDSEAISRNARMLASGHWDGVTLWNIRSGKRETVLRGFGRYVISVAFSPNGKLLAAGTDTGVLQIWDVRRHKVLHSVQLGGGYVSDPAFSPDGRRVAVGTYGTGTAWLINVGSGKIVDHAKVSDLGCGSVAFSPDGRYLITPSTGGLITWPYDEGGTIRVFRVRHHAG